MKPATPNEFNPVLGIAMCGMAATVHAAASIARYAMNAAWINGRLHRQCRAILDDAETTRARTRELAQTLGREELTRARKGLMDLADDTWEDFSRNFEPGSYARVAREELEYGARPDLTMHRWVAEVVRPTLDYLDRIQALRIPDRRHEWQRLEQFKQELVDLWGKRGFEVARPHGRERSYIWRSFWKTLGKVILYPTIAVVVVVAGVYIAFVAGVGM